MKQKTIVILTLVLTIWAGLCGISTAGDWRFAMGPTYMSGYADLVDIYEDNLESEGFDADVFFVPVGVSVHPYFEFLNGIQIGVGLGPMLYITGDADYLEYPVSIYMGYSFLQLSNWSPYVRGGIMYHIVTGDYVEGSNPGPFGAVGIEFMRHERIGFGFEIGYDASEVEIENYSTKSYEDLSTMDWMASIFVIF